MSKLGNIYNSYGSQFNVAIANTYSSNILNGNNLPSNSIIISSPIDENGDDIGSYSLIISDSNGNPVRLTYTIQEGNGLIYDNDSIKLNIDTNTITDNNHNIGININSIIDNSTIKNQGTYLYIDKDNLKKCSENEFGTFIVDGKTILSVDGTLTIDTNNLDFANKDNLQYGVGIGDGNTIISNNGVFSVNTNNLKLATENNYGVLYTGSSEVNIDNGVVSINTDVLPLASNNDYGIVKPDDNTLYINENNQLALNDQNLIKADVNKLGTFKYDPNTLDVDKDGYLSVKNINNFDNSISKIDDNINKIKKEIKDIDYLLKNNNYGLMKPQIYGFSCSSILSRVLNKPLKKDEEPSEMQIQIIDVEFTVNTNCPFTVSVLYEDNIDPQISLYEINYDNVYIHKGNLGLGLVYQGTNLENRPIKFTFLCRNYASTKNEYSKNTKMHITISSYNDNNISKSIIYSIIRFNSKYSEEIEYKDNNIENYI